MLNLLVMSFGTVHFVDRFCASRKVGIRADGWVSPLR